MADYLGSQNIQTKDAGDVDVFVSDATTPSQKLKVNADGSIDTNTSLPAGTKVEITDGTDDLEINADGSINAVVSATDLDIRDLDAASDSVEAIQDTHDDLNANANMQVGDVDVSNGNPVPISDAGGSITVDATDLDIRDLSASQDNIAISDGTDTLAVNADGSINSVVTATDLDIRDLDAASDSVAAHLFDESGNAFDATNPLPVEIVDGVSGDSVCDYNTTAALAAAGTTNHDYVVSGGKTLLMEEAYVSAGGYFRAELLINGATTFVGFGSPAMPVVRFPLEKVCRAAAGQTVRITIENCDDSAMNVYSTLTGIEV